MPRSTPSHDRYSTPDLQQAYEEGFSQMSDHDSHVFVDRIEHMADEVHPERRGGRSDAMAAACEGAADALRALAVGYRDVATIERALDDGS